MAAHGGGGVRAQRVRRLLQQEAHGRVPLQLALVHALAVHVLRDPVAGDHRDDDAEQEVDAPRALHHNDHLHMVQTRIK